ncbi:MAG: hypothetical protein GX649_13040 [Chloroflexi bacterium]|nr:hypothetical protein [Chloroflexota bacterium]
MKISRLSIALTVLALAALLATGLPAVAQTGTWVSGIMIQNQSTTEDAEVTVQFFWAEGEAAAGQLAHEFTDTIPAGGSKGYWVPSIAGLPDNFVGSAVVSSNVPVVANVNTQVAAPGTEAEPNRVGTASGVLDPATTLYFTQVMRTPTWNSYIAVQNTSSEPASVTVRYYNDTDGNEAASDTQSISAFSTRIFRQGDYASLPTNWGGSAVVTSDRPIAGIANFYNEGVNKDTSQFHSYNAFSAGGTRLYVPRVVVNYYDYQSGIKVQNVGTAATDVTITYYFGGQSYTQVLADVQPGAAKAVYLANVPDLAALGRVDGAAIITSSGDVPIVATVNEDNRVGAAFPGHEGRGVTYNAFVDGAQTDTIFFSQVTNRATGYTGGIQVQNVGTDTTTVTTVWSAPGKTTVTSQKQLAPNASVAWFAPQVISETGFNGSVTVTADQPIVGIANGSYWQTIEPSDNWAPNVGDSFLTYNGVNR